MAATQSDVFGRSSVPPVVDEALRSSGQQLDPAAQTLMSSRFGHDFSRVRIHADSTAADSARAINAEAYTVGHDVVFNAGRYQPTTSRGQHLIAHELTHVLQQSSHDGSRSSGLEMTDRDHPSESEARSVADRVMSGSSTSGTPIATAPAQGLLQRDEPEQIDWTGGIRRLMQYHELLTKYRQARDSGRLSPEQIAEIDRAIDAAEAATREANELSGKGSGLYKASGGSMVFVGGLVGDDLSGIGVADDVLIPFALAAAGILALSAWIASSSSRDIERANMDAVRAVGRVMVLIEAAILPYTVPMPKPDVKPVPEEVPVPRPPGEVIPIESHPNYRWHGGPKQAPRSPEGPGIDPLPPLPVPRTRPDPEERKRRKKQPIPIRWPTPWWHYTLGAGDPGQYDDTYDRPTERILIKRGSTFYNPNRPEIGRYVTRVTNPPFNCRIEKGWPIHHKWPLFLGGPGNAEQAEGEYDAYGSTLLAPNLVAMSPSYHVMWHQYLAQQPEGPRPGEGPSELTPDGTQFLVLGDAEKYEE